MADTGSVGGFSWFLETGAQVDFWRFSAVAGQTMTLDVNRLNGNLDPGLSLYSGMTTADTSLFSASGNWGGLTFIGSLDDEHPAFLTPGPGGDPFGSFVSAEHRQLHRGDRRQHSTDAGSYPYRVTLTTAVAAVPEPETWAMLASVSAALGFVRRRRQS